MLGKAPITSEIRMPPRLASTKKANKRVVPTNKVSSRRCCLSFCWSELIRCVLLHKCLLHKHHRLHNFKKAV